LGTETRERRRFWRVRPTTTPTTPRGPAAASSSREEALGAVRVRRQTEVWVTVEPSPPSWEPGRWPRLTLRPCRISPRWCRHSCNRCKINFRPCPTRSLEELMT
ncbi:unnamed protein product, partial [Gulo gulo]